MSRHPLALGFLALILMGLGRAAAADGDAVEEDEQTLKAARLDTTGPALLDLFRQRTLAAFDQDKIKDLIGKLGDDSAEVRKKAAADLVALGSPAVPLLRQAADGHDIAVVRRVKECLKHIEIGAPENTIPAAARLLAVRKPAGAAEVLLNYLPSVSDDQVDQEVRTALAAVAYHDGAPDRAVVEALQDKLPVRRAAAAEALCRQGGYQVPAEVRRLLQDREPMVRMRVALALADRKDGEAVPVLIALLPDLSPAPAQEVDAFLRDLAGDLAPSTPLGNDGPSRQKCQEAWNDWWRKTDGPALLELFRRGTPSEVDREKITVLVGRLGDDDFAVRERASADLVALGPVATPLLRLAARDPDVEIAHRAEGCLKQIERGPGNVIPASAARLLALRKPAGATRVLLAYLPLADSEQSGEEVRASLTALAFHDGKADADLVQAVADKLPARRAAAAVALCRGTSEAPLPEVRRLLQDPEPMVRLRVALAAAEHKDKEAVPVLIALLRDLSAAQLWEADELLRRIAGSQAPDVALGTDETSKQLCHLAWEAWYRDNAAQIDLARLDSGPHLLGYTLIVQLDSPRGNGRVLEVTGPENKIRWQVEGLNLPLDAQVLPGNRVLIAEYQGSRVTERNFKGDILWQKPVNMPINVQRLPNGDTFIATQQQLLEVDRNGKETVVKQPQGGIMGARKLRDGQVACITQSGMFVRMDAHGKELKSFAVGQTILGGFDVLPNGHVLVSQYGNGKVTEFDTDGKSVWEVPLQLPGPVSRLANGHTLIASQNTQSIIEVDHAGKKVWDFKTDGRVWQARRR